jgi:SAM-dependent methyltransferase
MGDARYDGTAEWDDGWRPEPFEDESFDAAISVWTHTDVGDFRATVAEVARVLRPGTPFVYIGGHPCFVGPHSLFVHAEGTPSFHPGDRPSRRYDAGAPGGDRDFPYLVALRVRR